MKHIKRFLIGTGLFVGLSIPISSIMIALMLPVFLADYFGNLKYLFLYTPLVMFFMYAIGEDFEATNKTPKRKKK